jgi:SAM-dependent methyltransferase
LERVGPRSGPGRGSDRLAEHYAAYYAHEAARGVIYGPERLDGQPRFEAVARQLAGLPPGARVLDYGCAHGHYTLNLARRFPHLRFLGVDLVESNIATARRWARDEGVTERVAFRVGTTDALRPEERFERILAAEVLEHVPEPAALADALAAHLAADSAGGGRMLITTPYGPWEALGYAEHHPWRAHLHHLERADLEALFGHHPGFAIEPIPAGATPWGEPLGSWLTAFGAPERRSGAVDLPRKLHRQRPRETLSVCMVVAPHGDTLARCLRSVEGLADEVILGIDAGMEAGPHPMLAHAPRVPEAREARLEGRDAPAPSSETPAARAPQERGGEADSLKRAPRELVSKGRPPAGAGHAWVLAEQFGATAFALPSPLRTGFAAARNATLERARGDWVLWIDDDEELLWPERLAKYLRDNPYDAYALPQHHFAVEPGGVIKTDYPCRLFRNGRGFAFHGIVHEHPELGLNGGAGRVLLLPDVAICHNGYLTEAVRRERFARNLPLMQRDRAAHPQRVLGRFLWIRDLAHLNRFEAEHAAGIPTGSPTGAVSPAMRARAEEAVTLWRGLLAEGHTRLALDALPYYSECAHLLSGGGIDFTASLGLHFRGLGDASGQPASVQGQFLDVADIEALTQALLAEKLEAVKGRYV